MTQWEKTDPQHAVSTERTARTRLEDACLAASAAIRGYNSRVALNEVAGDGRPGAVFISFSSKDLAAAERIRDLVERGGIACWIANRDIEAGASYPAAVTDAVKSASALLLIITEASNASPHVLSEVELAFNARTPILPVRLSPVPLSPNLQYFLGRTQWFDAGADFDAADAARLHARLAEVIAGNVADRDEPLPPATWRRRGVAAVSVLALVMLAAGTYVWFRAPPTPGVEQPSPGRPTATSGPNAPTGTQPSLPTVLPAPASTPASEPPAAPAPGPKMRVNAKDGATYVWIPPGRFTLGCSPGDSSCEKDESPAHVVRIRTGFWMGRTEVTRAQHAKGRNATAPATDGDTPVVEVDRGAAKAFCASVGGRLPTESEWEYAARAGTTAARYEAVGEAGWYSSNSGDRAHPAAQKAPNAFALYDMLGNVYEWVLDRYYNQYDETDEGNPVEEPTASNASGVARGGAYASEAKELRASNRLELPTDAEEAIVGFRCVADR